MKPHTFIPVLALLVSTLLLGGSSWPQGLVQGPPPANPATQGVLPQDPPPPPPEGALPDGPDQPLGPPPGGPQDRDMAQMVEQLRMVRISEELGLNDEQTVLLVRRMSQEREAMQKLRQERQEMVRALRQAIKASASEADIKTQLDALMAKDQAAEQTRRESFDRIAGNLNTVQRAKLYVFLQEFEGNLRQMVQRARERGAQGMGQGPGAGLPGGQAGLPGRNEGIRGWRQRANTPQGQDQPLGPPNAQQPPKQGVAPQPEQPAPAQ